MAHRQARHGALSPTLQTALAAAAGGAAIGSAMVQAFNAQAGIFAATLVASGLGVALAPQRRHRPGVGKQAPRHDNG